MDMYRPYLSVAYKKRYTTGQILIELQLVGALLALPAPFFCCSDDGLDYQHMSAISSSVHIKCPALH